MTDQHGDNRRDRDSTERPAPFNPIGMLFGIAVGVAIGLAMENIAIGVAIGMGIGMAFSVALGQARKRK